MKIAVNARFLLAGGLEGFGAYTHEIVRRMAVAHPEDEFLLLFDRPFDPQFVYGPNVTPLALMPQARHPILFRIWFEWSVVRALKRHGADVFFSPDSMCSLRSDTPTLMTCHDLWPLHFPELIQRRHRAFLLRYLPLFIRRADRIATVSEYVRQDLIRTCGTPPEKILAVHNGCRDGLSPLDERERAEARREWAVGEAYFLFVGAIHPRKNVHRLIAAFDLFKSRTGSPVKLALAGRFAWQTGEVKSAYEAARHRDDIIFIGFVQPDAFRRLMGGALALLFPSLDEGFGLPIVEAMHTDTPVLTSNLSAMPEVAGDAALLVNPMDPTDIAAGLERLHGDPALRAELIERGRKRREQFSWDAAAQQIYAALVELREKRSAQTVIMSK
ncbi:MAG: glycosyltransferase family 4 protein [Saprospiraceae bacterium]